MANTRNASDYDGAVTALESAGGDTSKLSDHQRTLIGVLGSESSARANKARDLIKKHGER